MINRKERLAHDRENRMDMLLDAAALCVLWLAVLAALTATCWLRTGCVVVRSNRPEAPEGARP